MYIVRFKCLNCKQENKHEIILSKKNLILCSRCGVTIITIESVNGCVLILSNKKGLVTINYSSLDYKSYIKKINRQYDGKNKFKEEAVFTCKNLRHEIKIINRNRKLKKLRSKKELIFSEIPANRVITIVEEILKKKPEWVSNIVYPQPSLFPCEDEKKKVT